MSLLVVGSVAFDAVRTPHGSVDKMLGGSATYFALAASYFTPVRVVGVVGDDFEERHHRVLLDRGVSTEGLERVPGKTFFWSRVKELGASGCWPRSADASDKVRRAGRRGPAALSELSWPGRQSRSCSLVLRAVVRDFRP